MFNTCNWNKFEFQKKKFVRWKLSWGYQKDKHPVDLASEFLNAFLLSSYLAHPSLHQRIHIGIDSTCDLLHREEKD